MRANSFLRYALGAGLRESAILPIESFFCAVYPLTG
jgi:hypothetical protein